MGGRAADPPQQPVPPRYPLTIPLPSGYETTFCLISFPQLKTAYRFIAAKELPKTPNQLGNILAIPLRFNALFCTTDASSTSPSMRLIASFVVSNLSSERKEQLIQKHCPPNILEDSESLSLVLSIVRLIIVSLPSSLSLVSLLSLFL